MNAAGSAGAAEAEAEPLYGVVDGSWPWGHVLKGMPENTGVKEHVFEDRNLAARRPGPARGFRG